MFPVRLVPLLAVLLTPAAVFGQTLQGGAYLPADSFAPGPTSGQWLKPVNGKRPPFKNKQPVQGFSSVLRGPEGDFYALSDNGFGAKANSADFLLRFYRIGRDFRTATGGTGILQWKSFVSLSDPDKKIPFPIVADKDMLPGPDGQGEIAVPEGVKRDRLLTGADFDLESFRQALDGSFWFGDEFGPFLLHTDPNGKLLEAPVPLEGFVSPDDPLGRLATIRRSNGFEGMALSEDGDYLYPMLEGALQNDENQDRLWIHEYSLRQGRFTGRRWAYRLDAPEEGGQRHSIGEITTVDANRFLVVERDNYEREKAQFKRVFLVDMRRQDQDGFLLKEPVVDLMNLADPRLITGTNPFTLPFQCIESVIMLNDTQIGVLNDNNFPFGAGREAGKAENTEFVVIKLDKSLR